MLPILFVGTTKQRENLNYISLKYTYDHQEKPIPSIIFHLDTFVIDEITFVGYKFKVSKKEFILLEDVIKKGSSYIVIDSLAKRYYDIILVKNGKRTVYGTVNLNKSRKLFSSIIEQVHDSKKYPEIARAFEYLYSALESIQ